jgi:hypothetical protein
VLEGANGILTGCSVTAAAPGVGSSICWVWGCWDSMAGILIDGFGRDGEVR